MEKLHLRSDGISEFPDGRCAVFMLRRSGSLENGDNIFSYRPTFIADVVTVQWAGDVGVFPYDVASALVARKYARYLTADEVEFANDGGEDTNETGAGNDGAQVGSEDGDGKGHSDDSNAADAGKNKAGEKDEKTIPDAEPVGDLKQQATGKGKK